MSSDIHLIDANRRIDASDHICSKLCSLALLSSRHESVTWSLSSTVRLMRRAKAVCSVALRTRLLFVESEKLPYTVLLVVPSLNVSDSLPYTSVSLNEVVEFLAEELLANDDCDEGHTGLHESFSKSEIGGVTASLTVLPMHERENMMACCQCAISSISTGFSPVTVIADTLHRVTMISIKNTWRR